MRAITIGREIAQLKPRLAAGYGQHQSGGKNAPNNLCHHVTRCLLAANSPGQEHAKSYSGVEMTARDWAYGIHHGHQRQPETQRDAQMTNIMPGKYRSTKAGEKKCECPE